MRPSISLLVISSILAAACSSEPSEEGAQNANAPGGTSTEPIASTSQADTKVVGGVSWDSNFRPGKTQMSLGEPMHGHTGLPGYPGAFFDALSRVIGGSYMGGYVQGPTSGGVLPFSNANPLEVDWIWMQPGSFPMTVSQSITFPDRDGRIMTVQLTDTQVYRVLPPPQPMVDAMMGTALTHLDRDGDCILSLGDASAPGAAFAAVVAKGLNPSGTLRWTQLVHVSRSASNLATGQAASVDSNGFVLDAKAGQVWATPDKALVNQTGSHAMQDSPGIQIMPGESLRAQDSFRTYLMWKSDTANSVFVPIWRADWSWDATGVYDQQGCRLTQGSVQPAMRITSLDYPAWSEAGQPYMSARLDTGSGGGGGGAPPGGGSGSGSGSGNGGGNSSTGGSGGGTTAPVTLPLMGTPPELDFGGAYGYVNFGQRVVNPATNDMSCPAGYADHRANGTTNLDYEVHFCIRPHSAGQRARYDYGGAWGNVEGEVMSNVMTNQPACAPGFTDQRVFGSGALDHDLHICYREPQAGDQVRFGGVIGMVDGKYVANTATGRIHCPAGFMENQVLGTANVDSPMSICEAPTTVTYNFAWAKGAPCLSWTPDAMSATSEPAACPDGFAEDLYAATNAFCPNYSCQCTDWMTCEQAKEFNWGCSASTPWLPVKIRRCERL